jgi:polyhydroxybutyrate depolymerase
MLTMVSGAAAEPMQLTVGGQARTFLLRRPAGEGPHPTIIVLHRGGGGADEEVRLSGLAQQGPQQGFVAVFPEARGGYWNFFPQGKENGFYVRYFRPIGGVSDDVAFLKTIVTDLVRDGISDPKRVFLVGRSVGGAMALRLICVDAGSFAAIGLLTTAMPEVTGGECQPAKPVPVIIINGTLDRVLPYKGERRGPRDILWSTERLVAFFRRLNGCAGAEQKSILASQHAEKVVTERSSGCSGGPVILHSIVGGGHDIPADLSAAQMLLDFFRDKAR